MASRLSAHAPPDPRAADRVPLLLIIPHYIAKMLSISQTVLLLLDPAVAASVDDGQS